MNFKFAFIALMVLAVSLASIGQSLVFEPETMPSWSGDYQPVPAVNDPSISSAPISTVPTSSSTPVSVEPTSPISSGVPPVSIYPSVNPVSIAPVLIDVSANPTPVNPASAQYTATSSSVPISNPSSGGSSSVPIAPTRPTNSATQTPTTPTSEPPNNGGGSGGTTGGNGGNSNDDDDDDSGRRRLEPITLPLEELSTSSESDEDASGLSRITGAVIGAIGKKGLAGIIILAVVLGVAGLVIYNRRKIGVVKAN